MRIKRYYRQRPISVGRVRAIRDVLGATLKWKLTRTRFTLYYPAEECTIDDLEQFQETTKLRGEPTCIQALFRAETLELLAIRTCDPATITIDVEPRANSPYPIFDAIEPILDLTPIDEMPQGLAVKTAFLAHPFDDEGDQYATEVARFLTLINISPQSGRAFSPGSVAQKVEERLARFDIVVAIFTCQADSTWLMQETIATKILRKPLFLLVEEGAQLKEGLLGDYERIPFPRGRISKAFIPILEGLGELHGPVPPS